MLEAWKSGHEASDSAFVTELPPPGSIAPEDTQTLVEVIDRVAKACGIPLFYE
jgi:hypothetical protein